MCQNPYRLLVFKNKKQYVLERIRQQLHSHYCIDVFLKTTKQVIFFKESFTVRTFGIYMQDGSTRSYVLKQIYACSQHTEGYGKDERLLFAQSI